MAIKQTVLCPSCGAPVGIYKNPIPTVDIIIEVFDNKNIEGIVLIERENPPFGWAIPGGFIDYGESAETAAVREAKEETNLDVHLKYFLGVYSRPDRDPRHHTISTVFVAKAFGKPKAGDDAKNLEVFQVNKIPDKLAFDHSKILQDYLKQLPKSYW